MSMRTSYSWFWPDVDTIECARSARMWGFWAVIVSGGLTSLITIWSLQTNQNYLGFQANEWSMMVVPISAAIAIGIYKENRIAALFGLVWYFAGQIPSFLYAPEHITKFSIMITCAMLLGHIASIRANFALYRLRALRIQNDIQNIDKNVTKKDTKTTTTTPKIKYYFKLLWGFGFLGILAIGSIIYITQFNAPSKKNTYTVPQTSLKKYDPQEAQRQLDLIFGFDHNQINNEADLKRIKSNALNGNTTAQIELGKYFYFGKKTPVNYAEAEKYLLMAAIKYNKEAQYYLGELKAKLPQTMNDAAGWYRKAAEQGHVESQIKLASILMDGRGVRKNMEEAYIWFSIAESLGAWDFLSGQNRRDLERQLTVQQLQNAQAKASVLRSKMNINP